MNNPNVMGRYTKGVLGKLMMFLIMLHQGIAPGFAQTTDFDGALIEHEVLRYGVAGETQTFETQVTDNVGVKAVTLFYKVSGADNFESSAMQELSKGLYQAKVTVDAVTGDTLFYYIVAEDESGNRSQKGLAFDPLERQLESKEVVTLEQPAENTAKAGVNWIYVALGVLALGAVAGAAAGGGGSSGSADSCGDDGCTFSLNLSSPE